MWKFDFPKFFFCSVLSLTVLGFAYGYGIFAGANRTPTFVATVKFAKYLSDSIRLVIDEASTLAKIQPKHFLQRARHEGAGVLVNDVSGSGAERDLILLTGFFDGSNELRLIRRDGSVVRNWPVSFSELFPDPSHLSRPPATDWNVDTGAALALPDGSVVFNFEYSGMVKLDRCGQVVWTIRRPTHHSVERAMGGGFWAPGRREHAAGSPSPFPPFTTPYVEDTLLRISEDGQILQEISVPKLLYENQLDVILTATGDRFSSQMAWDRELVHLNKIEELTEELAGDFPDFAPGDLALSLRNYNLVLVVDPVSRKIKWWQIGPWRRQHDPEFRNGGKIVVFNNNTYRTAFVNGQDASPIDAPRVSNVMQVNPTTGEESVLYGNRRGQELLSIIRGKIELTPRGGLLITEFEAGRVIETDAAGRTVWSYLNRYDNDSVAEIGEARLYPEGYFDISDWSCVDAKAEDKLEG